MWHALLCTSLHLGEAALGMVVWSWEPVSHSPDFEVFYDLLHAPQLSVQPASFSSDAIQLAAEVIEVGVEEGLLVLPDGPGAQCYLSKKYVWRKAGWGMEILKVLLVSSRTDV